MIVVFVWALCKAVQVVAELFGYWFLIQVMFAVCGLGVTESGLIWVTVLAVALFALNRTLVLWTEMEVK